MSTKIPPPPKKKKQKNMVTALDKFVSYLLHNSTRALPTKLILPWNNFTLGLHAEISVHVMTK